MNCPNCGQTMVTKDLNSVLVDVCPACAGMWLDVGELQRLKDASLPEANWLDVSIQEELEACQYSWGTRACPVCSQKMANIAYGETGIMLDACVQNHGIFLDQGEFDGIIKALEQDISTREVPEYVRAALQEAREIIDGPQDNKAEWQDFKTVMRLMSSRVMVEHPRFAEALAAFATTNPLR